jgi:hypothetical protein
MTSELDSDEGSGSRDGATPKDDRPTVYGLTLREVARRYRVSPDKVRTWIRRGDLKAVNTAMFLCGKPRWVVLPEALAVFERVRASGPPPKTPRRKKDPPGYIDFFPD